MGEAASANNWETLKCCTGLVVKAPDLVDKEVLTENTATIDNVR